MTAQALASNMLSEARRGNAPDANDVALLKQFYPELAPLFDLITEQAEIIEDMPTYDDYKQAEDDKRDAILALREVMKDAALLAESAESALQELNEE